MFESNNSKYVGIYILNKQSGFSINKVFENSLLWQIMVFLDIKRQKCKDFYCKRNALISRILTIGTLFIYK